MGNVVKLRTRSPAFKNNGRQFCTWSVEREERYMARMRPNPAHVKHLRAGIEAFRRMLEARYGSRDG